MFKRFTAGLTAFVYLFCLPVPVSRAESAPAGLPIPGDHLGRVDLVQPGARPGTLIILQDAHSIPEAQKNLWKLIEFYQEKAGVKHVFLEGASGMLDTSLLKSFPDQALLSRVLESYLERGEMAGGSMAAVLSPHASVYEGAEDWSAYEEGIRLYVTARNREGTLRVQLAEAAAQLQTAKEALYPPELARADHLIEQFAADPSRLAETLRALAEILAPEEPELQALLDLEEQEKSPGNVPSAELRLWAENLRAAAEKTADPEARKKNLARLNALIQLFQTSAMSGAAFARALERFASDAGLEARVPEKVRGALQDGRMLENLEDSPIYPMLEAYSARVKASLMTLDEERELDRKTLVLRRLKKLSNLEISYADWESLTRSKELFTEGELALWEALRGARKFYENAALRDTAFLRRLEPRLERKETVLFVAGGFHSQELARSVHGRGFSVVKVSPALQELPEADLYGAQMQGEVSWKNYLETKDGKIALFDGFHRAVRDSLLEASTGKSGRLLRDWRNRLIARFSREGRVEEAAAYLALLDEASQSEGGVESTFWQAWQENIRSFVSRLQNEKPGGAMGQQPALSVRELAAIPAYPVTPANFVPRSFITESSVKPDEGVTEEIPEPVAFFSPVSTGARSELRSLEGTDPAPEIPVVTDENRASLWDLIEDEKGFLGEGDRTTYRVGVFDGRYIAWGQSKTAAPAFIAQEAIFQQLGNSRRDYPRIAAIHRDRAMLGFELFDPGGDVLSAARGHFSARDLSDRLILLLSLARSLAYLHQNGVLHRDFKPANIYLPQQLLLEPRWNQETFEKYPPVLFDFENAVMLDLSTGEPAEAYRGIIEQERSRSMSAISRDYAPFSDAVAAAPDMESRLAEDALRFQHRAEFDFFSYGVTMAWLLGINVRGTRSQADNDALIRGADLPEELRILLLELTDKDKKIENPSEAWEKVISVLEERYNYFSRKYDGFVVEGFPLDEDDAVLAEPVDGAENPGLAGTRTLEIPQLTPEAQSDKTLPFTLRGEGTALLSPTSATMLKLEMLMEAAALTRDAMIADSPELHREHLFFLFDEIQKQFPNGLNEDEVSRVFLWFEREFAFNASSGSHPTRYRNASLIAALLSTRTHLLRGLETLPEETTRVYLGGDGLNQLTLDPRRADADHFFINRYMLLTQEELDFTKRLTPIMDLPFEDGDGQFVERPIHSRHPSKISNQMVNQGLVYSVMKQMIRDARDADPTPRAMMEFKDSRFFRDELARLFAREMTEGTLQAGVLAKIREKKEKLLASELPDRESLLAFFEMQIQLLEQGSFFQDKVRAVHEKFRAQFSGEGPFELVDIGIQGVQQFLIELAVRYQEGASAPVFRQRLGSIPGAVLDHYDFSDNSDTEDIAALEYFRLVEFSLENTQDPMRPGFGLSAPDVLAAALVFMTQGLYHASFRDRYESQLLELSDLPENGFVMLDMDDTLTNAPMTLASVPRTTEEIIRLLKRGVPVVINTLNSSAEMRRRIFEPIHYLLTVQREPQLFELLSGYAREDTGSFDRSTGKMPMVYMTTSEAGEFFYESMTKPSAKEDAVIDFQRRSGRSKFAFFDDQFGPRGWAKTALGLPGGVYFNVDERTNEEVPGTVTDPGAVGVLGTGRWLRLINAVIDTRSELRANAVEPGESSEEPLVLLTDEGQGLQWNFDMQDSAILGQGERAVYYRGTLNGKPAAFGVPKGSAEAYLAQAELAADLAGRKDTVRLRAIHPEKKFLVFDILPEGGTTMASAFDVMTRWPIPKRLQLLRRIAETYRDLSAAGILHRDLKPDNIFLPPELYQNLEWTAADLAAHPPIVLDFDLAMAVRPETRQPRSGIFERLYRAEQASGMEAVTMDYAPFPDSLLRTPGRISAARFRESTKLFQHDPGFDLFSFGVLAAWMVGRNVAGFQQQSDIDREIQGSQLPTAHKRFLAELLDKEGRVQNPEQTWQWVMNTLEKLEEGAAEMLRVQVQAAAENGTRLAADPGITEHDRPTNADPAARSELRLQENAESARIAPVLTRIAAGLEPGRGETISLSPEESEALGKVISRAGYTGLEQSLLQAAALMNREGEIQNHVAVLSNTGVLKGLLSRAFQALKAKAGDRKVFLVLDLTAAEIEVLGFDLPDILGEVKGLTENVIFSSTGEDRPVRLPGPFVRRLESAGYASVIQDPSLQRSERMMNLTGQEKLGLAALGLDVRLPASVRNIVEIGHQGDFSSLSQEEKVSLVRLKVFLALAVALEKDLTEAALIRQYGLEAFFGTGRAFVFGSQRIEIVLETFHTLMQSERAFAASA